VLLAAVLGMVGAVVPGAQAISTGAITGSVTVPEGYDVRAVSLFVRSVSGFQGYGNADAWVDANGAFTVSGLTPGDYYVGFATYWSDMQPCSNNRDRWWSGPGQANGTCNGTVSGGVPVTVTSGGTTDLGSTPLLTTMPVRHYSGRLLVPAGHTAAGLHAEVWLSGDEAWPEPPGGWNRLTSVPVQTIGADGRFAFDLISPMGSNQLALRFTDPAANGYAFSFARGGLTATTPGAGGTDFGTGAIGLLALPSADDVAYGDLQVAFPLSYVSGSVTLTGAAEWGRTLTAHSDVVWSNPSVTTTFQWYRDGAAVDGAVGPSYVLNGDEDGWGAQISAQAIPVGPWAYNGSPVESPVVTIENTTPLNVGRPVVSGSPVFGKTLVAGTGDWRPTSPTYTYAYQWYRGATAITGATSATYRTGIGDIGQSLSVEVQASRPPDCPICPAWFTGPGVARSVAARVVPATMPATWIRAWSHRVGKARVRATVRVTKPLFSALGAAQHPAVRYQWYAAGKRLPGATHPALKITKSLRHKAIRVVVTVTKVGYAPRSRSLVFGKVR